MNKASLIPCRHPTTVYWVDDNKEYLHNAAMNLAHDVPYRLYSSPFKLLKQLEPQMRNQPPWERFVELDRDNCDCDLNESLLRGRFSKFVMEIDRPIRFERVSVVIVDYAMDGMDGVELSRHLSEGPFKIILLTGKADEKTAVAAFNEGIINCFLFKNRSDLEQTLKREVSRLQQEFFYDLTAMARGSLYQDPYGFLCDPYFIDFFLDLYGGKNCVEYYLRRNPLGFYLIDAAGKMRFLAIHTEQDVPDYIDATRDLGAPEELVHRMESRRWMPFFPSETNILYERGREDWGRYLHPVEAFSGNVTYYYSVLDAEDLNLRDPVTSNVFPFNNYLDRIDAERFGSDPVVG